MASCSYFTSEAAERKGSERNAIPAVWPQMSSQSEATLADSTATKIIPRLNSGPRLLNLLLDGFLSAASVTTRINLSSAVTGPDRGSRGRGAARTIGSAAECKHAVGPGSSSDGGIFIKIIHGWLSAAAVTYLGGNGSGVPI